MTQLNLTRAVFGTIGKPFAWAGDLCRRSIPTTLLLYAVKYIAAPLALPAIMFITEDPGAFASIKDYCTSPQFLANLGIGVGVSAGLSIMADYSRSKPRPSAEQPVEEEATPDALEENSPSDEQPVESGRTPSITEAMKANIQADVDAIHGFGEVEEGLLPQFKEFMDEGNLDKAIYWGEVILALFEKFERQVPDQLNQEIEALRRQELERRRQDPSRGGIGELPTGGQPAELGRAMGITEAMKTRIQADVDAIQNFRELKGLSQRFERLMNEKNWDEAFYVLSVILKAFEKFEGEVPEELSLSLKLLYEKANAQGARGIGELPTGGQPGESGRKMGIVERMKARVKVNVAAIQSIDELPELRAKLDMYIQKQDWDEAIHWAEVIKGVYEKFGLQVPLEIVEKLVYLSERSFMQYNQIFEAMRRQELERRRQDPSRGGIGLPTYTQPGGLGGMFIILGEKRVRIEADVAAIQSFHQVEYELFPRFKKLLDAENWKEAIHWGQVIRFGFEKFGMEVPAQLLENLLFMYEIVYPQATQEIEELQRMHEAAKISRPFYTPPIIQEE